MGDNWYISRGGQQYGPYTFELLQQMARNNQVLPADQVWSETTGVWVKASEVTGLFQAVTSGSSAKEKKGRYVRNPNQKKRPLKKVLAVAAVVIIILAVLGNALPDNTPLDEQMKRLDVDTYFAAKFYELANLQTARVLNSRPQDVSYETWKDGMKEAIALWEEAEKSAGEMEATSDRVVRKAEKEKKAAALFRLGPEPAYGYTSKEILAMYDAGPKGQKLKNLAKQLGVSAKYARAAMEKANAEIEAKVWNDQADLESKMEKTLTAVKDVSKVTVYTGGAILSGGATSAFQAATLVVNGADLVLKVGSDISSLAFGNEETTALLNDIRTLTEPAAAIMGIADLAKLKDNLSKLSQYKDIFKNIDKVDNLKSAKALKAVFANKIDLTKLDIGNSLVYTADQLNSYFNPDIEEKDRKILGLNIATTAEQIEKLKSGQEKAELKVMSPQEVGKIMGVDTLAPKITNPLKLMEEQGDPPANPAVNKSETNKSTENKDPEKTATPSTNSQDIVGTWLSIGRRDSAGTLYLVEDKQYIGAMTWTFTADGKCERKTAGKVGFIGTYSFQNGTGYADIAHPYEPDNKTRISLEMDGDMLFVIDMAHKKE